VSTRGLLPALAAIIAIAANASAGEYRNEAHRFSMTIPDDWVEIPAAEIASTNAEVARRNFGTKVEYIAGFRQTARGFGMAPYILIQPLPNSIRGASYDELERSLSRELGTEIKNAEGAIADLGKNLQVGSAALDRSKNRVVIRLQMDVVGQGRTQTLSVGHLGAERIIMVHAYAIEQEFQGALPTFERINDSFRFDPGHQFTPGSGGFWGNVGRGAGRGALIGAIVGLVIGLFVLIAKVARKKPRSRQRYDEDE
jgi:hypothetical protein